MGNTDDFLKDMLAKKRGEEPPPRLPPPPPPITAQPYFTVIVATVCVLIAIAFLKYLFTSPTTPVVSSCDAIVDEVINSTKWSKSFRITDPQCGVLGWARDGDSDGLIEMMANGDKSTIRPFRKKEIPNYNFPVTSIQFRLISGSPVYIATGSHKALDKLRARFDQERQSK